MSALAGTSYLVALAVIGVLLASARGTPHPVAEGKHVFRYSRMYLAILLLCIPIWIVLAAIGRLTAKPGIDNPAVLDIFGGVFLGIAVGTALVYVFAKKYYVAVDEGAVHWRKFRAAQRIDFANLEAVEFKQLNRGLERISLRANGKVALEVTSLIQDFGELKMLMEVRAKHFGVPLHRS